MEDPDKEKLLATITTMAEKFSIDGEGMAVRAMVQGAMMMTAAMDTPAPPLKSLVKIADVVQDRDDEGDYLPYYTLVLESGRRIRISVELES